MTFQVKTLRAASALPGKDSPFAEAVKTGLSKTPKTLPSWLLFDDRGSELFKKITELDNYPPYVCEAEILNACKQDIADLFANDPLALLELGSGDGEKAKILIREFIAKKQDLHYMPIDITDAATRKLVASLEQSFASASLKVTGLVADFFEGLRAVDDDGQVRKLVLFLGATLGNRSFPEMEIFLKQLHDALNADDYVMIGFDLMKHPKLIYEAYNDPQGRFSDFNLYMLDRINEELQADFNKDQFVQQAQFNWNTRAVESQVISVCEQTVTIQALEQTFQFKAWETLQTERSYKYTEEEIDWLAERCGFHTERRWYDSNKGYVMQLWRAC
ncbi:MAG: L-histidine N(alpha)-methyltransferase [Candidatus Nitrohelix vancouverensis]|uniref:L-histidine N(Alpha)-methyltransferase n=1 Tax=Candidatus Nitrohelix vancouverensis TaxID=2705534 RepID=A0A7T0G3K5_9BACT|nr:MAG: L-histidine N(alpha)-methyltransferase [Candidatus Nitrohelix vancouverensis]